MGVNGLWTIVHPCARPIKIETLNKKRLAVDASIWIYQFLKAVRDKEGNQLRNSHIVGFFRRICKLLFVGIKPVFVFDGGAPALKRQTINSRKQRREGRREDAARTAGKLLALQMQRAAEEEKQKRKDGHRPSDPNEEEPLPETFIYAEEVQMTEQERQKNRTFRKTDAYHLPALDASMADMGQPNDPRIMSLEELQQYATHFNSGEDINLYDFSKIDFDGTFFQSLPPADRYNILNAARLRSRLRMGYSKDQLDTMFPDRMAFSKFQIDRVRERNELTQRLMRLQGMNIDGTLDMVNGRIAGERGREYILVKNDGVEGGWVLGVVTQHEGTKANIPIDVDELDKPKRSNVDEDDDEENEFEDVPIEGLNRLPKPDARPGLVNQLLSSNIRRRRDFYKSRHTILKKTHRPKKPSNSLFVEKDSDEDEVEATEEANELPNDEEDDLQRAIDLSLATDHEITNETNDNDVEHIDDTTPIFGRQKKAEDPKPFFRGSGMAIAHMANMRANKAIVGKPNESSDEDEDIMSIQRALKQSKKSANTMSQQPVLPKQVDKSQPANYPGFDGPLPFEKINLGSSLFDKKKKPVETAASSSLEGGFVRNEDKGKKKAAPIPPWFSGNGNLDVAKSQNSGITRPFSDTRDEDTFVFESSKPKKNVPFVIEDDSDEEIPRAPKKNVPFIIEDDSDEEMTKESEVIVLSDEETVKPVRHASPKVPSPVEKAQAPAETVQSGVSNLNLHTTTPEKAEESEDDDDMEWEDVGPKETPMLDVQPKSTSPAISQHHEAKPVTNDPDLIEGDAGYDLFDTDLIKVEDEEDQEDHTYSDAEDEELFKQIIQEEEEHERFKSSLNQQSYQINRAEFDAELKRLRTQQKKDRRDADEVTQTMITECQQLLALFGLPYIIAPMEAEAQCAELVSLGLVDGVVTDDSDIFLFGGTRVYKNMFNQAKVVECYLANDLKSEFGLDRPKLIAIAQLLGSDYTEGLPGVGPVTALEIISEFERLENFRTWFTAVQNGTRSKAEDANSDRQKFRRYVTKITLPSAFPDVHVEEAYLKPEIDSDPSQFIWGVPDLDGLRSFLMQNIGWSPERTDEVLVPVIRDMNRRDTEGTQSNITAFFGGGVGAGAFAPRQRVAAGSKRLRSALERMGQRAVPDKADLVTGVDDPDGEDDGDGDGEAVGPKKRTRRKKR